MSQYYAAFVASGVGLATGTALGWMNGPIHLVARDFQVEALPKHNGYPPLTNWLWHSHLGFKVTGEEYLLVLSSLNVGATIVSIPCGFLIDAIGRKSTLLLLSGPFICGWMIVLASTNVAFICIGRGVLGVAAGASTIAGPIYLNEIADEHKRGLINGCFKLQMTLGILLIYVLSTFLSTLSLIVSCILVDVIVFAPIFFLPETPLYLLWSDRYKMALETLIWLRGKDYEPTERIHEIKSSLSYTKTSELKKRPTKFFQRLRKYSSLRALLISFILMCFLQLSGINFIVVFSIALFGYQTNMANAHLTTILCGIFYCLATAITIFIIDRVRRRLLLLISTAAVTLLYTAVGTYYYFENEIKNLHVNLNWLPIALLILTFIMYAFGLGTVPWLLVNELFPTRVIGRADAMAKTLYWLVGGLVNFAAACSFYALGIGLTFWIFAAMQLLNFCLIYFLVPETLGKSTLEINEILTKK